MGKIYTFPRILSTSCVCELGVWHSPLLPLAMADPGYKYIYNSPSTRAPLFIVLICFEPILSIISSARVEYLSYLPAVPLLWLMEFAGFRLLLHTMHSGHAAVKPNCPQIVYINIYKLLTALTACLSIKRYILRRQIQQNRIGISTCLVVDSPA